MLKNHWRLISRFERIADNALIVLAFIATYYLRDPFLALSGTHSWAVLESFSELGPIEDYYILLGVALPMFNAFLSLFGGYRSMRFSSYWILLRTAVCASISAFFFVAALLFMLKLDMSRSFVGLFCALSGIIIFVERAIVLKLLRFVRVRGRNYRNVLIAGSGKQAEQVLLEVRNQQELGVKLVGIVAFDSEAQLADTAGIPLISSCDEFERALKNLAVDEVIFTDVVEHYAKVKEMVEVAADEGVRVTLAADLFSIEIAKSDISYFGNIPLIYYQSTPRESTSLIAKRAFDVVISVCALVVLSPVFLLIAILVKLESPGPIFFRQKRVGLNGRLFTLLKFRSMVQDAENMLDELKERNEMTGPVFKIRNDPRVTKVGKFIRRFSIDELPQFINVLVGDMSLVGPRPPLPEEVSKYQRKQRRRLSMRPGITCTWQVSGRNEIPDFEKWAELDLEYIDTWSFGQDLKLLLKTIPAVLTGFGAR